MIEHFEKGYSPSALQRKYKLSYPQARQLADDLKVMQDKLKEHKEYCCCTNNEVLRLENYKLKELLKECGDLMYSLKVNGDWGVCILGKLTVLIKKIRDWELKNK